MKFESNFSKTLILPIALGIGTVSSNAAPAPLKVVGNKLRDSKGSVARLQGVNIPSLEWGATGENVMQSIDVAIDGWKSNIIRVPLSQDLWFGYPRGAPITKTARSKDGGAAHRRLIDTVVKKIAAKNCYVLLDLHWSNGGNWGQYVGQHCMPDTLSLDFWKNCAARYANNSAVLFDLYNEPHDVSWDIWKNGGIVEERNDDPGRGRYLKYRTPGMQAMLNAVRSTGAKNVVIAGGLDWGYSLTGIMNGYALKDSNGNGVVYGTHIYPWKKDWDKHVTPVVSKHPVFVGEVGTKPWQEDHPPHENVYTESWAPEVIAYMEKHQMSWTAWSFHPSASPCLISGWDYKPTPYWGAYVKAALAKKPKRVVVWNGEEVDKGGSWTNPTTATLLRAKGDAHSGDTALEFKFTEKKIWVGCGFDWMDWKTGRDVGTDTSGMANLRFWLKSKGITGALEVQLLCNGDVVDTPEHHAPKMRIADYCATYLDGQWHEVVIPLADMAYPVGYDPKVVTMIDFGFWTEGEANGSFLIDDIAFDDETRMIRGTGK